MATRTVYPMLHLALVVPVSEMSASITHKCWCVVEWTPNWCWIGHLGMLRMSHKLAFRPRNATLQQTHLRRDATPSSDSTKLGAREKKCFLIRKIFSNCKYLQMFLFTRCNHCKEVDAMTKEMKVGRSWVPILEPAKYFFLAKSLLHYLSRISG